MNPERFFTFAASTDRLGVALARLGLIVVLLWIGGLKIYKYEADGIVPFVANSPVMSFFYEYPAPDYRAHMNPEGALVPENRAWHEANRTYTFSYGLGALIMSIGILVFLGIFFPKVAPQPADGFLTQRKVQKLRAAPGNDAYRGKVARYAIHAYFLLKRASHLLLPAPCSLPLHCVVFSLPVHSTFWGT